MTSLVFYGSMVWRVSNFGVEMWLVLRGKVCSPWRSRNTGTGVGQGPGEQRSLHFPLCWWSSVAIPVREVSIEPF